MILGPVRNHYFSFSKGTTQGVVQSSLVRASLQIKKIRKLLGFLGLFIGSVVSNTLRPHGLQLAKFMEFSRQYYWSGLPFPTQGYHLYPGIKPGSPALQADSLPSEPPDAIKHILHYQFLFMTHQTLSLL